METGHLPPETTGNESSGYERQDADVHAIVLTGGALAIGILIVGVLVYGIFRYLADHPATTAPFNPMAQTEQQQFPPPPRIDEHPALELKDLHVMEDSILTTYGWTDKAAGTVRIPLDRAIELQLQRGFPARQEAKQK